jgi:hypothetical protein
MVVTPATNENSDQVDRQAPEIADRQRFSLGQ